MIQIIIAKMVLAMAPMATKGKAEKVDKTRKTISEAIIETRIRTFLMVASSIRGTNLERGSTGMTPDQEIAGRSTISETMMMVRMIDTTLKIKDMAEIGQIGVTLTLRLSDKFGSARWTEKLDKMTSRESSKSSELLRISRCGKTLLLCFIRIMRRP